MVLSDRESGQVCEEGVKTTLVSSLSGERSDESKKNDDDVGLPPFSPAVHVKLSTLQKSSFIFLPAATMTVFRAVTGSRLLLSDAWTCGVFLLSVANHSRDYHTGPRLDALDFVDKAFAWALGMSCVYDGLAHLPVWRFLSIAPLGLATLAFYVATRYLKTIIAEDTSPAAAFRARWTLLTPEKVHVCMHITAGVGAFLVVL